MINNYIITLIGCDDITQFEMGLTEKEAKLVKKICQKSEENSEYSCMPVMRIEKKVKNENN